MTGTGNILETLKNIPPILWIRRNRYYRKFERAENVHLFRGVFSSFAEAVASAPATKPISYDHPEPAKMYRNLTEKINYNHYPVIFWLSQIIPEIKSVFDLGGHIGLAYYQYKSYIKFPENIRWVVCDVPSVAKEGTAIACERNEYNLEFTDNISAVDGMDILVTNGALQYIETPLALSLDRLNKKPKHLIINLVPMWEGKHFYTLNSIGTAFCGYTIFNRKDFIQSICSQGYHLVDDWENIGKKYIIPFYPQYSKFSYYGAYFTLI